MKWTRPIAIGALLGCLLYPSIGVGCAYSAASHGPFKEIDLDTLHRLTPPLFKEKPLFGWREAAWPLQAEALSEAAVLHIERYLIFFSKNPAKAERVLKRRYSALPANLKYLLSVEDNVITGYLLLWFRGEAQGNPGSHLDFALEQLKNLTHVEATLKGNGRVVFQIALWAKTSEPSKYPQFLDVMRASPWAFLEFDPILPRP